MPHDAKAVGRYLDADVGIERCGFNLPSRALDETTRVLDPLAEFVQQFAC